MPSCLEISLKPQLIDAHGAGVAQKAKSYFGIALDGVRSVNILTLDADLSDVQLERLRTEIFTNPVIQVSSYAPLEIDFDWVIWVGYRPGVRDNPGATAVEAIEDLFGLKFTKDQAVYTSMRYCCKGKGLTRRDMETIAKEILANDIIQQWKVFSKEEWDPKTGVGVIIPKVKLDHEPSVSTVSISSDEELMRISDERNLALNPNDIPTIRSYFLRKDVLEARKEVGLSEPTDVELEYISQARSDHCNHNTFGGKFFYTDLATGEKMVMDNLFKSCISDPTKAIAAQKPWVISVLWDNAGVGKFDDDHYYSITGETHNSPSNMEAYGGAITGIVGVYRDPMGTGKGSKLIAGTYGFCVGPRDYNGDLKPRLTPRRLLDGIIEGVKDGGNKSGIPTAFGQVCFDPGYLGKCLVFVTALGLMPAKVDGGPSEEKTTSPGELVVMCGGRVGKDGIHGVTASSEVFSEHTPAGHVQIGDPYTQKKMHDFLLEARDQGLIAFITDNGGGGLSSSVGESARFSDGCKVDLAKVPLKYDGLDQWEIWVSESQERMTLSIKPEHEEQFFALAKKHAVECTVIGTYTDSGKLHITYKDETCAYVDMDLLTAAFPQWEFEAEWVPPELRGLKEPVLSAPADHNGLLLDMLNRPNICSKEWITRQYDHEVQGTSAIKPLVGKKRDTPSDGAVYRPVLTSESGIAISQAVLPTYSAIDAYHMTACVMDEAVRRVLAVGADPEQIGGVDNFCWPTIIFDEKQNPDGKHKAAQLVRSCLALRDLCNAYDLPLLSGKDSMYVDGHLPGRYGERHKVSALETLQFTTTGLVHDVAHCKTMDVKAPGDLVYIAGLTKNELGASEYYEHLGHLGLNVPKVDAKANMALYKALYKAMAEDCVASVRGVYRGGLAVHLALCSMAGCLGMDLDLAKVPAAGADRDDALLYSESAGRFILTVAPSDKERFEEIFAGLPAACVGQVTEAPVLSIKGLDGVEIIRTEVQDMKDAWKKRFGGLI
ncbi:AIR synthase-related protein [Desulfatibacillum aliphaticivorans]|uniref:AIR synthase-related protein n=1 Tax=Desulfatibacillum aliphaticivorans TaxID=218208 RepID=UPI00041FCDD0|nr:AIR synthase-related protein [Desulfatibacillum aliphaticivorans]